MLKIVVQVVFGKIGKEFRLGTSVDFTNAVYQLSFTHMQTPFKKPQGPLGLIAVSTG